MLRPHRRTCLYYGATFPSTCTPYTSILDTVPTLPPPFTDDDLELLKKADTFVAERKTRPTQDQKVDTLLESFDERHMADCVLDLYRERQYDAIKGLAAGAFLVEARTRPLEVMLDYAQKRVQGARGRRQASADQWYTRHAPAIFWEPTSANAVDTMGGLDMVHILTHPRIGKREGDAVKAGRASLGRVYGENMALWHSPQLFTPTEERALILKRMEGNNMLLNAAFPRRTCTLMGLSGDESEAMEILRYLGALEETEIGTDEGARESIGRARRLVEYALGCNAIDGGSEGGFTIDEEKAIFAVGVAMGYEDEHGVWVGQRRSGGGLTKRE